jgi:hypothetical protein
MRYSPVETTPAKGVDTIASDIEEQTAHNDAGEEIIATPDIYAEATLLPAEKRRWMFCGNARNFNIAGGAMADHMVEGRGYVDMQ